MLASCASTTPGPLEVGTGEDAFTAITADQALPIIRGSQGGYHVWVALRTDSVAPGRADLTVTLRRDDGEELVSSLGTFFGEDEEGRAELLGYPAILPSPEAWAGREISIEVDVRGDGRAVGSATARVDDRVP